LREVHRVLRVGGSVGLTTWGLASDIPARDVWNEEIDRHGAPPAAAMVARHDLMDTPEKVRSLLDAAGFGVSHIALIPWSYRPSREEFVQRHATLGITGRRLAGLSTGARSDFLRAVQARLERLQPGDFEDRSEVIGATAVAA
jgi:hypothetical protein